MVNKSLSLRKEWVPGKFFTTMHTQANFRVDAGIPGIKQQQTFEVKMNSLHVPFDTPGYANAIFNLAGYQPNPAGELYGQQVPMGYNELRRLYSNFRVHASRYSVACYPGAAADVVQLAVRPRNHPEESLILTAQLQGSAPFGKSIICQANNAAERNKIVLHYKSRTILGYDKDQYSDVASTAGSCRAGAPSDPADILIWDCTYATLSNQNPTTNLNFMVQITYFIEFFTPDHEVVDQTEFPAAEGQPL